MERTTTGRGFALLKFKDSNGVECNIQKSSAAEDDFIWLGAERIDAKVMVPGNGWQPIDINEDDMIANNRMHLNRKAVWKLLPALIKFVITGRV